MLMRTRLLALGFLILTAGAAFTLYAGGLLTAPAPARVGEPPSDLST